VLNSRRFEAVQIVGGAAMLKKRTPCSCSALSEDDVIGFFVLIGPQVSDVVFGPSVVINAEIVSDELVITFYELNFARVIISHYVGFHSDFKFSSHFLLSPLFILIIL
jgi:hypothetical protein